MSEATIFTLDKESLESRSADDLPMTQKFQFRPNTIINEKLYRCQDFKDGRYGKPTTCYVENTPKEELILEHVIQYKKQFKFVYDESRELYINPKNECDVYKFICTTIRPTKLGFLELYDYERCARYIANFITYEELDPPDEYPKVIPSPTNVMKWQRGDCFDISILLCSLLIGVGYDAYCVMGNVERQISAKNESYMDYLFIDEGLSVLGDTQPKETTQETSEFNMNARPKIESKFDKSIEDQKNREREEAHRKATTIDDETPDGLGIDPYEKERKYCWVLLKAGKRGITSNLFIDPATGRIYDPSNKLFEKVDCVFNNKNYWINLQNHIPCRDVNFDEMDTSKNWEYVMLDTLNLDSDQNPNEDENNEENLNATKKDDEDDEIKEVAKTLDMPPPWPPKITLDYEAYIKGSPMGESMVFYSKCKVEKYAEYSQVDGLVTKITIYQDYKRLIVKEIRYIFMHRSDKLVMRRRFPFYFRTIEYYDPGKPPHWRVVDEVDRRYRTILFYANRNHDGLIKREEIIGEKTMEYYNNRDDRVIYRSVRYEKRDYSHRDLFYTDNHVDNVVITKLTQKFEKNPNIPANEQIAKMIIDLSAKQKITIFYHMNEGDIAPVKAEYLREDIIGMGKMSESGEKKIENPEQQQKHQRIFGMEKEAVQNLKAQEALAKEEAEGHKDFETKINNLRATNSVDEANKVILEKTLHDKAREKYKLDALKKNDEILDPSANDFLRPYLEKRGLLDKEGKDRELSYQEALDIKNEVMDKLKQRILARAEIIQKRLDEEKAKLEKEEQRYQKRGQISAEEEKAFIDTINTLHFKIEILDQRASRFEMTALQRYENMDKKLNGHEKLKVLQRRE